MVVAGSEDVECESTDRLIAEARSQKQKVTYLRIEGMAHNVSNPQFNVMSQVLRYIKSQNG